MSTGRWKQKGVEIRIRERENQRETDWEIEEDQ